MTQTNNLRSEKIPAGKSWSHKVGRTRKQWVWMTMQIPTEIMKIILIYFKKIRVIMVRSRINLSKAMSRNRKSYQKLFC